MKLYEDEFYIKTVDFEEINNFVVDNLIFYLKLFMVPKICFKFSTFEVIFIVSIEAMRDAC